MRFDAVGSKHRRCRAHEELGIDTRIVGDGHGGLVAVRALIQIIGKALRGLADRMDVHAVRADADDAAQTGGAERKRSIERIFHCRLIAGVNQFV